MPYTLLPSPTPDCFYAIKNLFFSLLSLISISISNILKKLCETKEECSKEAPPSQPCKLTASLSLLIGPSSTDKPKGGRGFQDKNNTVYFSKQLPVLRLFIRVLMFGRSERLMAQGKRQFFPLSILVSLFTKELVKYELIKCTKSLHCSTIYLYM